MKQLTLAWHLALSDIQFRYARSFIGPLWITLQMALFVIMLGTVLSEVHGTPLRSFIPFFAVSLLFWNLLSASVAEGMEALREGAGLIKDRGVDPIVPVLQAVIRNLIISAHCVIVPLVAMVAFGAGSPGGALLAVPGMVIFVAVMTLLVICVSSLAIRYRDIKRIVETVMMLSFLATPILWEPGVLRASGSYVLTFNPFAHLFAVWREPLLSGRLPPDSLAVSLVLLALLALAAARARRWQRQAAFWI
jgi:ABC-type polysaccharide/polyol phosphate export permease